MLQKNSFFLVVISLSELFLDKYYWFCFIASSFIYLNLVFRREYDPAALDLCSFIINKIP